MYSTYTYGTIIYIHIITGIPVPIVAIAAGIAHKHYGTKD